MPASTRRKGALTLGLALALALSLGCGPSSSEPCSTENCDGCCDGDQCREPSNSFCGTGGVSCRACGAGGSCEGGVCVGSCGGECDGCCSEEGMCLAGDTPNACGIGGTACLQCPEGADCLEGRCAADACAMGCDGCCMGGACRAGDTAAACGSGGAACEVCNTGHLCQAGVCEVEPSSRWDLYIVEVGIPTENEEGQPWDSDGPPDPYVRVSTAYDTPDFAEGTTPTVTDSYSPTFPEPLLSGVKAETILDTSLGISLYDEDGLEDYMQRMASCGWLLEAYHPDAFNGMPQPWPCSDIIELQFVMMPN